MPPGNSMNYPEGKCHLSQSNFKAFQIPHFLLPGSTIRAGIYEDLAPLWIRETSAMEERDVAVMSCGKFIYSLQIW